ncbi:MAG: HAD family hydrolase [Bacteroidota bacterium]
MIRPPFETIIFDLDGTLIDSSEDIIVSLAQSYSLAGLAPPVMTTRNIGPKLPELIQKLTPGITLAQKEKIILHYRSIYDSITSPKTKLLPGVLDILNSLRSRGINIFIATNKPKSATIPLLKFFQIDTYFREIMTPTSLDNQEINKREMITHLLSSYKLDPEKTMMVGDHIDDLEAGKSNKIKTVAFLGGYSSPLSLKEGNPDYCINELTNLMELT